MEAWLWDREYALGMEELDRQRRELVRLISHWCSPKSREAGLLPGFDTILARLDETFQGEARHLAELGAEAEAREAHGRCHRDFQDQLRAWRPELPCLHSTAESVRDYMIAWLEVYFLDVDAYGLVGAEREDVTKRYPRLNAALYRLVAAQGHMNTQLLEANVVLGEKLAQRGKALADARSRLESEQMETTLLLSKVEEAQRLLIHTEKMAAIGQLAAGISHEINNPVGFILSNFGALEDAVERLLGLLEVHEHYQPSSGQGVAALNQARTEAEYQYLPDDLRDILRESRDGLERIKRIVQNLKDFSHVDESDWQEADLNQCVVLALNLLKEHFSARVVLEHHLSPLAPVHCVPAQINQVLLILINNALQALPEAGGHITLRTGSQRDQAWIEVQDTGRGMGAEVRHRIFEPFFTTRPVGQGTGLGLSLAWDIVVQRHGGSFDVSSDPGTGTRMRVWLPFAPPVATVVGADCVTQALEQAS